MPADGTELASIWDYSVQLMYPPAYVAQLASLLRKTGAEKILDAACGTGYPAIDLYKEGVKCACSDASQEMLGKFHENCRSAGAAELRVSRCSWKNLPRLFGENAFDAVLCRGNSLIYADSWGKNRLNPEKALAEIRESLAAFHSILRAGGFLYVDTVSRRELAKPSPSVEVLEKKSFGGFDVGGVFFFERDFRKRVRTWKSELLFWKGREIVDKKTFSCKGYLLPGQELARLLREAGFSRIYQKQLPDEKFYEIFIAKR